MGSVPMILACDWPAHIIKSVKLANVFLIRVLRKSVTLALCVNKDNVWKILVYEQAVLRVILVCEVCVALYSQM